jgi:hypothetical protein
MFSNHAETRKVVEFGRAEAMTYEERWNAGLQTRFIAYAVGMPSIVSTAFVGAVSLWYAWISTSNIQTWLAFSAGLLVITLFSAGLPIAWASTRDNNKLVARAALGLWLACVAMNFVTMSHFARHVPALAPARAPTFVKALGLSAAEVEKLDWDIAGVWYKLADFDEEMSGPRRRRFDTAENRRQYAAWQEQLQRLEIKRYGAPVILKDVDPAGPGRLEFKGYAAAAVMAEPTHAGSAPGLGLAAVALIMIAGSAVGFLISAGSLAAIMTSKVREQRAQAVEELMPEMMPASSPRIHAGESLDGFTLWTGKCLSPVPNGSIRPAAALAHYEAFCAANNVRARLDPSNFYTRFSQYLGAVYGIVSDHSNGPIYRGAALFDDAEMGAHPGALNGHADALNGYPGG